MARASSPVESAAALALAVLAAPFLLLAWLLGLRHVAARNRVILRGRVTCPSCGAPDVPIEGRSQCPACDAVSFGSLLSCPHCTWETNAVSCPTCECTVFVEGGAR